MPAAGEWNARVWLVDAAGNESRANAQSVRLRLDDSPPNVRFGTLDASDPTRIDVIASDTISPLSRAEVEIQRHGRAAWVPLATSRSGQDSPRALTTSISRTAHTTFARGCSTARATSDPLRSRSQAVAPVGPFPLASTLAWSRAKSRSSAHVGQTAAGRASDASSWCDRQCISDRTIPIRGRLTTPGENPVANASIEVWEQVSLPGALSRRVAVIGTDRNGRFRFKALRGPSRVVRFRYVGSPIVRARTAEVEIQVKATTTIRTNHKRVVNGEDVVLSGRVLGQQLPSVGKLVQLQAYSRGRWITFATPRAGRGDRAMDVPLSLHVNARDSALQVPCSRATGSGLPIRIGRVRVRPRGRPWAMTKCATLLIVGLW